MEKRYSTGEYGDVPREIPRAPMYPNLSPAEENILEEIVFRPNDPLEKTDALFVFWARSHMNEQEEFIHSYSSADMTTKIILSWWIVKFADKKIYPQSESQVFKERLEKTLEKDVSYLLEDESTNCHDNVVFSKERWYFDWFKKIWFLCAEHASRRTFGSLKSLLPWVRLLQYAIPYIYDWVALTKETWKDNILSKSRVWWELLRIKKYWLDKWNFDVSDIYTNIKKLEKYL